MFPLREWDAVQGSIEGIICLRLSCCNGRTCSRRPGGTGGARSFTFFGFLAPDDVDSVVGMDIPV
jgi:hypothetical protein